MRLTACYDLEHSPPTYDFVGFLIAAEAERTANDYSELAVRIIPGPEGGFRADGLPPYTLAERRQMRDQIVVPMAKLLHSCVDVVVQEDRSVPEGATTCFGTRRYGTDLMVAMMHKNLFPLRATRPYRQAKPYVTITLRQADYHPTRNSAVDQWLEVAEWLKQSGFEPIFVRDTKCADTPMEYRIAPVASTDLAFRARLYAGAALNLFVNNGPAWMAVFMGVPLLICKLVVPETGSTTAGFFRSCGLPPGSQIPNARPRQHLLWADDKASDIIDAARPLLALA